MALGAFQERLHIAENELSAANTPTQKALTGSFQLKMPACDRSGSTLNIYPKHLS
jgi:hypothetical protein